jgi:hypothetical protein
MRSGASSSRYLAGLSAAALALVAGGWLVLTPFAFGYRSGGRLAVTALATGGALALAALVTVACWALAWRRRLRADGVLPPRQSRRSLRSARRQARAEQLVRATSQRELAVAPDPAQVLTDLRALLTPLLGSESPVLRADESVIVRPDPAVPDPAVPDPAVPEPAEPQPGEPQPGVSQPGERQPRVPEPAVPDHDRMPAPPGHLRGTRSASFLAAQPDATRYADDLMRGAELLMVGSGEEEAW